jgi:hypothetical protein
MLTISHSAPIISHCAATHPDTTIAKPANAFTIAPRIELYEQRAPIGRNVASMPLSDCRARSRPSAHCA